MDTFIKKTRKLDKRFTESLITISQLGVKSKKNRETDRRVKSFLAEAEDKRKEYEKFSKLNTKQID
jgi:hypothetical protein